MSNSVDRSALFVMFACRIVGTLVLALHWCALVSGQLTWYVDGGSGDDMASGTSEVQAFATIQKAVEQFSASPSPAHTIKVKAGVYVESGLHLDEAGQSMTIEWLVPGETVFVSCSASDNPWLLSSAVAEFTLRGFDIQNCGDASGGGGGGALMFESIVERVTIEDTTITNNIDVDVSGGKGGGVFMSGRLDCGAYQGLFIGPRTTICGNHAALGPNIYVGAADTNCSPDDPVITLVGEDNYICGGVLVEDCGDYSDAAGTGPTCTGNSEWTWDIDMDGFDDSDPNTVIAQNSASFNPPGTLTVNGDLIVIDGYNSQSGSPPSGPASYAADPSIVITSSASWRQPVFRFRFRTTGTSNEFQDNDYIAIFMGPIDNSLDDFDAERERQFWQGSGSGVSELIAGNFPVTNTAPLLTVALGNSDVDVVLPADRKFDYTSGLQITMVFNFGNPGQTRDKELSMVSIMEELDIDGCRCRDLCIDSCPGTNREMFVFPQMQASCSGPVLSGFVFHGSTDVSEFAVRLYDTANPGNYDHTLTFTVAMPGESQHWETGPYPIPSSAGPFSVDTTISVPSAVNQPSWMVFDETFSNIVVLDAACGVKSPSPSPSPTSSTSPSPSVSPSSSPSISSSPSPQPFLSPSPSPSPSASTSASPSSSASPSYSASASASPSMSSSPSPVPSSSPSPSPTSSLSPSASPSASSSPSPTLSGSASPSSSASPSVSSSPSISPSSSPKPFLSPSPSPSASASASPSSSASPSHSASASASPSMSSSPSPVPSFSPSPSPTSSLSPSASPSASSSPSPTLSGSASPSSSASPSVSSSPSISPSSSPKPFLSPSPSPSPSASASASPSSSASPSHSASASASPSMSSSPSAVPSSSPSPSTTSSLSPSPSPSPTPFPVVFTVSIGPRTSSGREGETHTEVILSRTPMPVLPQVLQVWLNYTGLAVRGVDFDAPATVTFAASATTAVVPIDVLSDNLFEGLETLTVSVVTARVPPGVFYAVSSTQRTSVVRIQDANQPLLSIEAGQDFFEDGLSEFIVRRSPVPSNPGLDTSFFVDFGGVAVNSIDYTYTPSEFVFREFETELVFAVIGIEDTLVEGPESVQWSVLEQPGLHEILPQNSSAELTLLDLNRFSVEIIADQEFVSEEELVTHALFEVLRLPQPQNAIETGVVVLVSGLAQLDVDYTLSAPGGFNMTRRATSEGIQLTLLFRAFDRSFPIALSSISDELVEGSEDVTLTLLPGFTYDLGANSYQTVSILDGTPSVIGVTSMPGEVIEGSLDPTFVFSFTRAPVPENPLTLTVPFSTSGSAQFSGRTDGNDYTFDNGIQPRDVISFTGSETVVNITGRVLPDVMVEGPELIVLQLVESPSPLYVLDPMHSLAQVLVIDDDVFTLSIGVSPARVNEEAAASGTVGVFTIERSPSPPVFDPYEVRVEWAGTADIGSDFVVLEGAEERGDGVWFARFQGSEAELNVFVGFVDDAILEANETVTLRIAAQDSVLYFADNLRRSATITVTEGDLCGADGAPCTILNQCFVGGACSDGVCVGEPLDCEDNNPCTRNFCHADEGCLIVRVTDGEGCMIPVVDAEIDPIEMEEELKPLSPDMFRNPFAMPDQMDNLSAGPREMLRVDDMTGPVAENNAPAKPNNKVLNNSRISLVVTMFGVGAMSIALFAACWIAIIAQRNQRASELLVEALDAEDEEDQQMDVWMSG